MVKGPALRFERKVVRPTLVLPMVVGVQGNVSGMVIALTVTSAPLGFVSLNLNPVSLVRARMNVLRRTVLTECAVTLPVTGNVLLATLQV
jgi:hypothetical protein